MNNVIYTDGNGTKVTTREFITRDATYLVPGIIDARMNQVKVSAVPAVFCIVAGLLAISLGAFHLLQGQPQDNFYIGFLVLTPNVIPLFLGVFLFFLGFPGLLKGNKKYTFHIITPKGERKMF